MTLGDDPVQDALDEGVIHYSRGRDTFDAGAQMSLYLPLHGRAQADALGPIHRPRQLQDEAGVRVILDVACR